MTAPPIDGGAVPYDAIVFDNDGVLTTPTDRERMREAARGAFAAVGVTDPPAEYVADFATGLTAERLETIAADLDVDAPTLWYWRDRESTLVQRAAARAGEKRPYDDVDALAALDRPLGVVSSNQHPTVEFLLEHFGLGEHFDTCYGREATVTSLRRKKPNPHYIRRALADLDADDALYVGDSEHDVTAAENAGMDAVFVRRPHNADLSLSVAPDHVIESLGALGDLAAE